MDRTGFHSFVEHGGKKYGSFEVFWSDGETGDNGENLGEGFYWWACFPGCLPDGDSVGPFATSLEAYNDAVESE